jgi:hypothetical protein
MKKKEFEEALRLVGEIARDRDLYVFGSQAIHGLLEKPPAACLISAEVDIYPMNHYQAVSLVIGKLGKGSSFATRSAYYVDCVSPDLSTLPDGWTERLVPFKTENTGGVTAWCLEIHDLCLAKLAASRPKDLRYIRALLRQKLVRAEIIDSRIDDMPTTAASKRTMRAQLQKLAAAPASKRLKAVRRSQRK